MYMSRDCQSKFLFRLIEAQANVSVYLRNGTKMTGQLVGATTDMIFLNTPVPQTIYKRRISAILPERSAVT
ncbi:MAG: RNA chaperone Hfq [Gammaproteobacteria bacterium]|nr:RNA chaperone Hfq [Gammaproteobacteria bacterium]